MNNDKVKGGDWGGSSIIFKVNKETKSIQEESHSGGTAVEFYTTVTLLPTTMSQR